MNHEICKYIFELAKDDIYVKKVIENSLFDRKNLTFVVRVKDLRLYPSKWGLYELNRGAYQIYKLINGRRTIGNIIKVLQNIFSEVDPFKLQYNVLKTIRYLERLNLVKLKREH